MNLLTLISGFSLIAILTSCNPLVGQLDLQPLNFVLIDSTGKNVSLDIFNKSLTISYTVNNTKILVNDVKSYTATKKYENLLGSYSILSVAFEQNVQDFTLTANNSNLGTITLKVKKEARGLVPESVLWNSTTLSVQPYSESGVQFGYLLKL